MAKLHFIPDMSKQILLFPERLDKNIACDDPVRILDELIDSLNLSSVYALYHEAGRSPYHPRVMLKLVLYAYMNNIYSARKMEKAVLRDIHFMWLAGGETPDFITFNRFRNRLKKEINNILTQPLAVYILFNAIWL